MAYRRGAKRAVSRFVDAGYTAENDLYIAKNRAGGPQDRLRDLNRRGYAGESPDPILLRQPGRPQAARKENRREERREGLLAWWLREASEDRAAALACLLLACLIFALGLVWSAKGLRGADNRRSIAAFNTATLSLIRENEQLAAQLAYAQNGERVRNRAQNELGMLRRERAETHQIYIQLPEDTDSRKADMPEEPHFEPLDVMLGILEMLHIGG